MFTTQFLIYKIRRRVSVGIALFIPYLIIINIVSIFHSEVSQYSQYLTPSYLLYEVFLCTCVIMSQPAYNQHTSGIYVSYVLCKYIYASLYRTKAECVSTYSTVCKFIQRICKFIQSICKFIQRKCKFILSICKYSTYLQNTYDYVLENAFYS